MRALLKIDAPVFSGRRVDTCLAKQLLSPVLCRWLDSRRARRAGSSPSLLPPRWWCPRQGCRRQLRPPNPTPRAKFAHSGCSAPPLRLRKASRRSCDRPAITGSTLCSYRCAGAAMPTSTTASNPARRSSCTDRPASIRSKPSSRQRTLRDFGCTPGSTSTWCRARSTCLLRAITSSTGTPSG